MTTIKFRYKFQMIIMLMAILGLSGYATAQSAEMKFEVNEITVQEGETFSTKVIFNTAGMPVSAYDIHLLYDTEFLQVTGVETLDEGFFNYIFAPTFDNSTGKVDMAAFQIGKETPSGDFEIVKISFLALAPTDLTKVHHPLDAFPKSILAYAGENIMGNANDLDVTITESTTVGIDDEKSEMGLDLSVWPNPSHDMAFVSFKLKDTEQVVLSIFDVSGKLIKELYNGNATANTEYKYEIEVSNFASGTYQCVLSFDGESVTKSMVVGR